ncbi:MAG: hypothetical protein QOC92_3522 [Acidimicrobiaceae bacterium]|jgi:uncharacterized protein (TIGR03083 family)
MDYDDHVAAVERETAAAVQAFRVGDMGTIVPTCPDWTLRDLAKHVGEFTGLWTHVLCEGTGREKTPYSDIPGRDEEVADWYAGLASRLLGELRATPPATEVWTWSEEDKTARFTARRCAHELAIHRFDAQTASGSQQPVDALLAADGIDEMFMMIRAWSDEREGSGRSLHLHGAEGDEWVITLNPDNVDVRFEHGPADLTLSGAVSDLELTLLQRPPIGPVAKGGDDEALAAWYRQFTFG